MCMGHPKGENNSCEVTIDGQFVYPIVDHVMILLRILAFKFLDSLMYMNE